MLELDRQSSRKDTHAVVELLGVRANHGPDLDHAISATELADSLIGLGGEIAGHARRVNAIVREICLHANLAEREFTLAKHAAFLHDVGKLAIEEAIVGKPGPLSETEMGRVREHAVIGSNVVMSVTGDAKLSRIVRHHHEWWNGNGYPDHLQDESIPRIARIVGVADALDAMMSDRPYRSRMSEFHARAELDRCAGIQFDPNVVQLANLDAGIDDEVSSRWS